MGYRTNDNAILIAKMMTEITKNAKMIATRGNLVLAYFAPFGLFS